MLVILVGMQVMGCCVQRLYTPNSKTYVGSGKVIQGGSTCILCVYSSSTHLLRAYSNRHLLCVYCSRTIMCIQ